MDLVQGLEDPALLGSSGPQQFPPDGRSDEEESAVEQRQACSREGGAERSKKHWGGNNLPVITVKINSQNQRKT